MIKLFNSKEGKWYDVPSNDVAGKLSEGWVGEAGVDYPVVNPDGQTVSIKAEDLNNAFSSGYRLTTGADIDRNVEAEQKRIRQENFGDPLQAGLTEFGSQGLLGAPDAIARAGEELGINVLQGFTEARKAQREESPIATLVGGVGSMFIPGGGLVGAVGKGAKEVAAANNIGKFGQLAAEGVVMGMGPGVTEAALGKPEDVAETLMASGLLGGVFSIASPYAINGLRKIGEEGVSATQRLVDQAAKKSMGVAVPVNQALGRSEEAGLIREVLDLTPEARRAIADRPEFLGQISDELKASTKAIKQETGKLTSDLHSAIKNMPEDLQESFKKTLSENANNLTAALDDSYNRYREIDGSFNEMLSGLNGPSQRGGQLLEASSNAIKKLESSANPKVKMAAEQIKEQLNSYDISRFESMLKGDTVARDATLSQALTEGQEVNLARTLKRDLNRTASRLYTSDTGAAKLVQQFADEIDQIAFKGHPNPFVAESAQQMDRLYAPLATMRKQFLGKSGTMGAKTATGKQIDRLFVDPEFRSKFENNLPTLMDQFPQLTKVATEIEGSAAQKAIIDDLKRSIRANIQDPNNLSGKLDDDDIIELARTVTGIEPGYNKATTIKNAASRLEDLKAVQEQITQAPNAFDKLLLVKKAQGLPISDDLKEMGKYYNIMDKLSNFSKNAVDPKSLFERAMSKGTGLGLGVGLATGNPIAGLGAMLATNAVQANPAQVLKRLATVEKATQKFKTQMTKAVEGVSQSIVKGASGAAIRTIPYGDTKKEYKDKTAFLSKMQAPDQMTDQIGNITGSAFTDVAPNVQMAVGTQYAKTISFLQSKVPQDPLAGKSLFYDKSGYQPPDSQISSFLRHVRAVEQPMTVLQSIKDGSVTKEEVDTLKAVYPGMYQRLQDSIMNAIIDHGEQIPYKRRLVLGTMFNVPTDPTLDPAFINKMQASAIPGQEQGRPQGSTDSQPRGSKLQLSDNSTGMSETDRVTYK